MTEIVGLKVLFVAGFGPVVRDPHASKAFYVDTLQFLEARPDDPDYFHSEKLDGVRHFALWPLALAAESCFGTSIWPDRVVDPAFMVGVRRRGRGDRDTGLEGSRIHPVVDCRKEPWGQTVTRMLSPEGILIGITFTPWLR